MDPNQGVVGRERGSQFFQGRNVYPTILQKSMKKAQFQLLALFNIPQFQNREPKKM
jgi:hypothetical protein